jgi:flagellin
MREVAVQAANDTNNAQDRANLQAEMDAMSAEIDRIAGTTTWAGTKILDAESSDFNFHIGAGVSQQDHFKLNIRGMTTSALGLESGAFSVTETDWGYLVTGDYLKFGVNYGGSLGNGNNMGHGIVFDPTGNSIFPDSDDYVAPGAPFEGFAVSFNGTTSETNNNDLGNSITNSSLTYVEGEGIVWTGQTSQIKITHTYRVTPDGKMLDVESSYEALTNLFDVFALRTVDPDAMINGYSDSHQTDNYVIHSADKDYVYSQAPDSKYIIGLINYNQSQDHKVGISNDWTNNAKDFYDFDSPSNNTTDATIGVVSNLGNLSAGAYAETKFRYFFGTDMSVINLNTKGSSLLSQSNAMAAINAIDNAIQTVNIQRSKLGAVSNRLSHTVNNLTNISSNLSAAQGGIEDADFAKETTDLAKNQILQQASTAMLAQANASKQNVLSLLQG